jgi:hypothetical protein
VPGNQADLQALLRRKECLPSLRSEICQEAPLLESLPARPESHRFDRADCLRAPEPGAQYEVRMRESQNEDGAHRLNAAASDVMLVSCNRCGTLHPPAHPLAFHPVCAACVVVRVPR